MKTYKVELGRSAKKELKKLSKPVLPRVIKALRTLEHTPRPRGCKKLQGEETLWRIRVGDYRIIYAIESSIGVVAVRKIAPRKEAYNR